jgi:hypothetical protein
MQRGAAEKNPMQHVVARRDMRPMGGRKEARDFKANRGGRAAFRLKADLGLGTPAPVLDAAANVLRRTTRRSRLPGG